MRKLITAAAAAALTAGCATSGATNDDDVYDPYEGFNRVSFMVNGVLDQAVIEPAARGYRAVTPRPARVGVRNFLANLNTPVVFVNDILQAEPTRASDTLFRFIINSTVGVGGLWDAAAHFGLEGHTEDFGQTLGVWGAPEGPYIVLPFLGPGNVRDGVGRAADTFIDPFLYTEFQAANLDVYLRLGRAGLTILSAREQFIEQFDALKEQPEPYVALRRAYTNQRRAEIRNGREDEDAFDDLPDFDDFDDFEDE